MKKILLVALAAAAMVGCSQNEEIENAGQKAEIKFGTVVSNTTKAVETNLAELQKEEVGFTVYAYNTGNEKISTASFSGISTFIEGKAVKYTSPNWVLDDGTAYYWPEKDYVQFFAYGNPGTGTLTYIAPTEGSVYPSFTYTVAGVDAQTDLVVAKVTDTNKTANGAGVNLVFSHALTQVNFTIKAGDSNTYKIKKLSISGVNNKGTYGYNTGWGTVEGAAPTVSYEYTPASGEEEVTSAGLVKDLKWMLMPQTLPATGATIKVSYDIYDSNGKTIANVTDAAIDLNGTTAWTASKKIRYTLTLANTAKQVTMNVTSVDGWNTSEDDVDKSTPKE